MELEQHKASLNTYVSTSFRSYCGARDAKALLTDHKPTAVESIHVQFPCGRSLVDSLMQQYGDDMIIREHYDVFYDDLKKKLLSNNYWLRFRDQQTFSLKYGVKQGIEENLTKGWLWFLEEKEERNIKVLIRNVIDPARNIDKEDIDDLATVPYAFIPFIRYEFNTPYGKIYVDEAKILDSYYYVIGTIKIHTEDQRKLALLFLEENGLDTGPVRSKVVEWLFIRNRLVYNKLVELGIVNDVGFSDIGHYDSPPIGRDNTWFSNYAAVLRERDQNTLC